MAEKISELTGEARERRIADLKQKMHEAAARAQAAHAAGESGGAAEQPVAAPVAVAEMPEPAAQFAIEATPVPEVATPRPAPRPKPAAAPAGNGSAAPKATPKPKPAAAAEAVGPSKQEMNRREFLTYAWGAALGLLVVETGLVTFFFMYPRFKAGEFGGAFLMGPTSALPPTDAPPQAEPSGKFWWVNIEGEGPKAIYMVCTHLGCLYKWVGERGRFECPCHGSKFTREGYYIEGPAPRSLDHFEVAEVEGVYVVDTGAKVLGPPASESPAKAAV